MSVAQPDKKLKMEKGYLSYEYTSIYTQAFEQFNVMDNEALSAVEGGGLAGTVAGCAVGGAGGAWIGGPVGALYGCVAGVGFYNGYKH